MKSGTIHVIKVQLHYQKYLGNRHKREFWFLCVWYQWPWWPLNVFIQTYHLCEDVLFSFIITVFNSLPFHTVHWMHSSTSLGLSSWDVTPGSRVQTQVKATRVYVSTDFSTVSGWPLEPEIVYRASQRSHGTLINPGIQVGCQGKLTRSYNL